MSLNKKIIALSLSLSVLAGTASLLFDQQVQARDSLPKHTPGELIIAFKKGTPEETKAEVLSKFGAKLQGKLDLINGEVAKMPDSRSLEDWIPIVKSNPAVKYAQPNYIITLSATTTTPVKTKAVESNPALVNRFNTYLWGFYNPGGSGAVQDADARVAKANKIFAPRAIITVAVIDTGIDYTHEALRGHLWCNPDVYRITGTCDPMAKANKGRDVVGKDFANNDNDPYDDNGHGTHVSGTITGKYTGVNDADGKRNAVKIMALKFLSGAGSGSTSAAITALAYAKAHNAKISSNSWGGTGQSQALSDAFNNFGGLSIIAAGNNSADISGGGFYPAYYNLASTIKVAASTSAEQRASFSNYSATRVDIFAPGQTIFSSYNTNKTPSATVANTQYANLSGTSMATPMVAGASAMIWSQCPSLTVAQVKSAILTNARTADGYRGFVSTNGILNVYSALDKACAHS